MLTVPATNSSGSYGFSWTEVSGATKYQVDESSNSGATWTLFRETTVTLGDTSGAARGATVSGKAEGTYQYRVRAGNAAGWGPNSAARTIIVAKPPAIPTGLRVTYNTPSTTRTSYSAHWAAVAGATSYSLKGVIDYSGEKTGASGFVNSGPNRAAVWQVAACNVVGCSAYSALVAAEPL